MVLGDVVSGATGAIVGGALTGFASYVSVRVQLATVRADLRGLRETNSDFLSRIERLEVIHMAAQSHMHRRKEDTP